MRPGFVRLLRVAAFVGPVVAILIVLPLVAPGVRDWLRGRSLPEGYEKRGEFGPYVLFARPDNLAATEAARILDRFTERLVAEWGEDLGLVPDDRRTELIVFSNDRDLEEFGKSELGSDFEWNGGFYLPDQRAIGIVGDRDPHALVGPLRHEGTHMVLDFWVEGGARDWSRWFDEGVASYFEAGAGDPSRERLGGIDPWLVKRALRSVREGDWPTMRELATLPASAWEAERNGRLYAKAALVVHALIEGDGGSRRGRFLELFRREREPGPLGVDGLEEVLGPLDAWDARLLDHLRSLR